MSWRPRRNQDFRMGRQTGFCEDDHIEIFYPNCSNS
jgi:hypothetical protein